MSNRGRSSVKALTFRVFKEYQIWRTALRPEHRQPWWYEDGHERTKTAREVRAIRLHLLKLVGEDFARRYREWAVLEALTNADHAL